MNRTTLRALTLAVIAAAGTTGAQAQTEIKVSYQPALYWALPFLSLIHIS